MSDLEKTQHRRSVASSPPVLPWVGPQNSVPLQKGSMISNNNAESETSSTEAIIHIVTSAREDTKPETYCNSY